MQAGPHQRVSAVNISEREVHNMISGFRALAAGTALAFVLAAAPASAATAGSNLSVSASVSANCTVTTSAMSFGSVDSLSGAAVDGTGGLTVTCTNGTAWTAAAGVGSGSGAAFSGRQMSSGSNLLGYNLFTDSGRATVWGDGSASTATIGNTGTGSAQAVTVYGRIAAGQTSVQPGSYSDTVAVTVTY